LTSHRRGYENTSLPINGPRDRSPAGEPNRDSQEQEFMSRKKAARDRITRTSGRKPKDGGGEPGMIRGRTVVPLLGLLTVVLLSVSFVPIDWSPLAYVALVPWVLGLQTGRSRRWELTWAWLAGVLFWAVNLYWLWWITLIGYAGLVVYLSLYWGCAAAILRAARNRKWPMWLTLPIVWIALEYVRAYVISGFPWFYLAHSQYSQTILIQVSDLTGQYGVSFFVAMVNGAVADIFIGILNRKVTRSLPWRRIITAIICSLLIGGGMIGYGWWRVSQQTREEGPVIGIVQEAFPISLTGRLDSPERILTRHLEATERFANEQIDLVIWPETMAPTGLNPEMLELDLVELESRDLRSLASRFFGPEAYDLKHSDSVILSNLAEVLNLPLRRAQAERIGSTSRRLGCPILAGCSTIHRNPLPPIDETDRWVTRNSVLLFEGSSRAAASYSKVHLVPFGEYVPFKRTYPFMHRMLRAFVPKVMEQLEPGDRFNLFELRCGDRVWSLGTPVCYEGTFARICRQMVMRDGAKRTHILANLSNDGWFVYKKWGRGSYQGSAEHPQHLVQYCFRAVENRVPIVRAVNTGISASIDSNGRILADIALTIDDYRKRTMIPGTLLLDGTKKDNSEHGDGCGPRVLVDRRVSVYSLVGDLFALLVTGGGTLMVGALLLGKRRRNGKRKSRSWEKKE